VGDSGKEKQALLFCKKEAKNFYQLFTERCNLVPTVIPTVLDIHPSSRAARLGGVAIHLAFVPREDGLLGRLAPRNDGPDRSTSTAAGIIVKVFWFFFTKKNILPLPASLMFALTSAIRRGTAASS
jgi:hypothetical protein